MAPERDTTAKRRLQAAVGTLIVVATAVAVLALAGVFSGRGDDREVTRAAKPARAPGDGPGRRPAGTSEPRLEMIRVGGRPTAIAVGEGTVWIADSFSSRASVLESEAVDAEPRRLSLAGPAADVTVGEGGAWFALPEQRSLERRELADPDASATVELEGFPSVVSAGEGGVWALSERSVQRIDPESRQVGDEIPLGGFASSVAAGEGAVWAVVDNRDVVRIDPASGEVEGGTVEVPEAFGVAIGEGAVWVVSASSEVTRIDPDSLQATTAPDPVRGALDVAAGGGSAWVTSSKRTVTRLDPRTLEPLGDPLPVGDEPASVSVGADAVWVANGGDGTLTRIEP